MNTEEKIKEMQERIYRLSATVNAAQHEVRLLQAELEILRGKSLSSTNENIHTGIINKIHSQPAQTNSLENFIGLRLIHLVGIVVLVAGISIGVKYAIDKELISEAMRIVLAYGSGVLLFVLSIRLKKKYQLFSAILFSGSMAVFYFTTYAAFVYYNFFPAVVAFLIMTALTVYTVLTAISYNRQEIAIFGMTGATVSLSLSALMQKGLNFSFLIFY